MTHKPEVIILPDAATVAQTAAGRIVQLAQARVAATGSFSLALSGGSTPRVLYEQLGQEPLRSQLPWQHIYVIWADERYLPPDDPASNYRLVRETLLDHVPVPPEQIYPVPTAYADPRAAAALYQRQVQSLLEVGQGQLDLVLLGMGDDGHTASLFPHHPELHAPADQLITAVADAPKSPPQRISLTVTAINQAAHVLFLVTGAEKATTLQAVLEGPAEPERFPAQLVRPEQGTLTWIVDAAAGQALRTPA
jgi:6-phosphogluconolactonase